MGTLSIEEEMVISSLHTVEGEDNSLHSSLIALPAHLRLSLSPLYLPSPYRSSLIVESRPSSVSVLSLSLPSTLRITPAHDDLFADT